jgi:hypothetical protein
MFKAIVCSLRFIILILAGHKDIALENAALAKAVDDPQKDASASKAPAARSTVVDCSDEDLETMENGARRRTTRYCCELVAAAIQAVLKEAVPEEGTRTSKGLCRSPEPGSNDGCG